MEYVEDREKMEDRKGNEGQKKKWRTQKGMEDIESSFTWI